VLRRAGHQRRGDRPRRVSRGWRSAAATTAAAAAAATTAAAAAAASSPSTASRRILRSRVTATAKWESVGKDSFGRNSMILRVQYRPSPQRGLEERPKWYASASSSAGRLLKSWIVNPYRQLQCLQPVRPPPTPDPLSASANQTDADVRARPPPHSSHHSSPAHSPLLKHPLKSARARASAGSCGGAAVRMAAWSLGTAARFFRPPVVLDLHRRWAEGGMLGRHHYVGVKVHRADSVAASAVGCQRFVRVVRLLSTPA
jgi:hypothetical protein